MIATKLYIRISKINYLYSSLKSTYTDYCTTLRGVHFNRGVSSLKPVSKQLAKTLIALEPLGIF